MGYVDDLNAHLAGIRDLLDSAAETVDGARVDRLTRRRLRMRLRSLRGQLDLIGSLAAEPLLQIDVLPGRRPVKMHRPFSEADMNIDAGG